MLHKFLYLPLISVLTFALLLFALGYNESGYCFAAEEEGKETTEIAEPDEGETASSPLAESMNAFAIDLYREIGQKPGNVFFSPGSIAVALSMTAAGAEGETQEEILKALHTDADDTALNEAYHSLLEDWKKAGAEGGFQLHVANRLWGQEGYRFMPVFLALTRRQYGAEFGRVDFQNQAEAAREEINNWVENQTAEKIKDLLPEGSINAVTRLVLVNAVYFKAAWQWPFEKEATHKADFYVSAKEKVKTSFMRQKAFFGYAENDTVQVLEMPYLESGFSMVVVLPRKLEGLADVEESLPEEILEKMLPEITYCEVQVAMPKFKLETSSGELNPLLEKLGIRKAFSAEADFSGISDQERLFLSAVYHKAYVDVNEEGTEAAAATGMAVAGAAAPTKAPPVFRADHPFIFFIRDVNSGAILFLGRLQRPN
jgi:serpin B